MSFSKLVKTDFFTAAILYPKLQWVNVCCHGIQTNENKSKKCFKWIVSPHQRMLLVQLHKIPSSMFGGKTFIKWLTTDAAR